MRKYYFRYKEIINYLIAGVLTTVVSLASYYFCVYTFLNPLNPVELQLANIISWICAVTFAYFTNRKFVFESKSEKKIKEAGSFYLSRIVTLLMDMGTMFILVTLLHINDEIAKIIVQFAVTILNYIFSKLFVFKKS